MKTLVRIHTQFEIAKAYQMHESLRLVVAEALGGSSQQAAAPENSIQTFDELVHAFSDIGGTVG